MEDENIMELEFEQGSRQEILNYLDSLNMNFQTSDGVRYSYFTGTGARGDTKIEVCYTHRGEKGNLFAKIILLNVGAEVIRNLEQITKLKAVLAN